MIKCVIFDMDGTLADTLPLCIAAFRKSVESISAASLTDQQIIDTFGPSEEGTISALIPDHYDEGVRQYLSYYEALHPSMCPRPFEGIPRLLHELKRRGCLLALVTGKGKHSLKITLQVLALSDLFDAVESGDPGGPCKPRGIRRVLETLRLGPGEVIYVGDVPSDITAAREAAVPVLAAAWANTADVQALTAHRPDALCRTVEQAAAYLLARTGDGSTLVPSP